MDLPPELARLCSASGIMGLLVPILASYAALDMARGMQSSRAGVAWRCLAFAGAAFGTGVASAHVIFMSGVELGFPLGYHSGGAFGAWLLAMALGLIALAWSASRTVTWHRLLGGGVALGSSIVVCQMVTMQTMGLRPGIDWIWPQLLGAWALASALSVLGLVLFWHLRRRAEPSFTRRQIFGQTLPAVVLGLAIVLSQSLVIGAANLGEQTFSAFDLRLPSGTLLMLATFGSLSLLTMMLVSSMLEARMRASLRRAKGELELRSVTDALTELPNRVMFEGALANAVRQADAHDGHVVLLFIDLDGFKPINELFGHHNGDRMLREIGARLHALARPEDLVARLGADEFLMLLTGSLSPNEVTRLADTVLETVNQSCQLGGREASVTCSVGIATYPEHGPLQTLIAHAEAAMRAAKTGGGAAHCRFEPHMMGNAREHVELLHDLRHALAQGELQLYYQPKVHAPSGEVTGAEALMRWLHPTRGTIGPAVFIPIAERHGLIATLGNWVIDEACRQVRVWRDEGLRMRVAINLSVHQLRQPDLVERVESALRRHQIKPELLTCEITESVAMEDPDSMMKTFEKLAGIGVHISIDDFGTGYSSLSYLRRLPAGELKIDRSFVFDLESSSDARAVVDAVVKLAQALGLKVVAEGVETEAQHQILRSLGCDELQGYLFARPMTPQAMSQWALGGSGPRAMEFRDSMFVEADSGALN